MGRRLKVLQVGPLPPPVGGMATVVDNLRFALADTCEVRVFNNVKTTGANRSLWQAVSAQIRLLTRLACLCLAWRPDVVHIHTCSWFSFWRSAVDARLARLLGRRVVLHIHGAQFRAFLDSLSPGKARQARWVFGGCRKVVVLGENWKALLDRWCEPSRVVVVPNGVPVQPARDIPDEGEFLIACLANYERRKGQTDLLAAVARLRSERPVRLALLGFEAEPGQRQAFLDQAVALGLADKVAVPGPVGGAAKDAWWARASCFCLPSYDEGLPMSMLEAMAFGLPVVVTQVGSIPEAVRDGVEGLLFNPGDVDALAGHLQSLLDDGNRARALGAAGRARLIQSFSLTRSAAILLDVYRDVMGRPAR